jgi:predicted small lipoprotein YifL
MKKSLIGALALLALLSSLTACGGSDEVAVPEEDKQELVEVQEQEAQATGGFDSDITLPTGEIYRLSSPTKFTPGKFAAGQVPGQSFNRFEVSVTNGGSADLDLAVLIVSGTTTAGVCVDIFDGDNNINGAPLEPLAAGASKKFSWALSCPGSTGDELKVKLFSGETALIEATGKLS